MSGFICTVLTAAIRAVLRCAWQGLWDAAFFVRVTIIRDLSESASRLLKRGWLELGADDIGLVGVSLGGFYAAQLRVPGIKEIRVFNPVVYPALQLEPFLGENARFYDGEKWVFTREVLYSYAEAPDPRVWRNSFWRKYEPGEPEERRVFLGDRDEILDGALAYRYWSGAAETRFISSGHSVEDFSAYLPRG